MDDHSPLSRPTPNPGNAAPEFRAPSSRGQTLERDTFRHKVPVVMAFLGSFEGLDASVLAEADTRQIEFGTRRIQLLGVVQATPSDLRRETGARDETITLLADADGSIAEAFGAPRDQVRVVLLDRTGIIMDMRDVAHDDWCSAALRLVDEVHAQHADFLDVQVPGDD